MQRSARRGRGSSRLISFEAEQYSRADQYSTLSLSVLSCILSMRSAVVTSGSCLLLLCDADDTTMRRCDANVESDLEAVPGLSVRAHRRHSIRRGGKACRHTRFICFMNARTTSNVADTNADANRCATPPRHRALVENL